MDTIQGGDFTLVSIFMEKAMAPHARTLAWKIPWMEEPGGLQSMGLLGVRYDWATSLSLFTFMHWRRNWQPTPLFLPGESQGRGSLVGCRLWGRTRHDWSDLAAAAAAAPSLSWKIKEYAKRALVLEKEVFTKYAFLVSLEKLKKEKETSSPTYGRVHFSVLSRITLEYVHTWMMNL